MNLFLWLLANLIVLYRLSHLEVRQMAFNENLGFDLKFFKLNKKTIGIKMASILLKYN